MIITPNKVIGFYFTLTADDGTVLDECLEGEPVFYLHGKANIVPGLEEALLSKKVGDKVVVTVPPEAGYGHVDETMFQKVPRSAFAEVDDLQPGFQFQAEDEMGVVIVTVSAIEDDEVTLDSNHPLAGMNLHFDVEVLSIRDANESELAQGRPELPGDV